jgi:hypothetical protein
MLNMKTPFPPVMRSCLHLSLGIIVVAFGVVPVIAGDPYAQIAAPTAPALIANISSRLQAEKSDAVAVNEFSVQGSGTKYVILRALGPSLRNGIPDALRNPTLTLLDAQGNILGFNDNWVDSPDKDAIIATGLAPGDNRESAIVHTLSPGIYTSVVRDKRNRSGTTVTEVYDLQSFESSIYFSAVGTRGDILTGDNVLISGDILIGTGPIPVLVRALGPSLAAAGVSRVLADPTLELHDGNGILIASNDNWIDSPQKDAIIATGLAPDDNQESALIVTLPPGAYTAVVFGVSSTTGIGFLQTYSLANPGPELDPAPIIRRRH